MEEEKPEVSNMETRIFEAAEELFLNQGYAKTSTGQIAKLTGCNQALVHYYYRTKDNLFDLVFESKVRLVVNNILAVDSPEGNLDSKIAGMVGAHFDYLKQNPKIIPFIFNELSTNYERLQSLITKLQQYPQSLLTHLKADLKEGIEKGLVREISEIDLLLSIASLNVTPFLIMPFFQKALNLSDKELDIALEKRKAEIIETIFSRLRK